jgi:hypothetical protein
MSCHALSSFGFRYDGAMLCCAVAVIGHAVPLSFGAVAVRRRYLLSRVGFRKDNAPPALVFQRAACRPLELGFTGTILL